MLNFLLGLMGFGVDRENQRLQNQFNAQEAEKARFFNAQEAEKQRDWSTAEREATQDWNFQQWMRENDYNNPINQMARMKEAGINPNAAMQQLSNVAPGSVRSSAGSGASASGPAASSAGLISSNLNTMMSNYWQNKMMQSQIGKTDAEAQGQREKNSWIGPTMMSEVMNNKANQMYVQEMTNNVKKLNEKYGLEIDYQKGFNDFSKEQWDFQKSCFQIEMAFRVQQYINSVNEGVNIEKQGVLIDEQANTEKAKQGLIGQETIGQEKDNKLKDIAISVGEVKAMFLKDFGIMCDDNTAGLYATSYKLRLEGKNEEADKLEKEYFRTFEEFAIKTQGRTWEHALGKVLQPGASDMGDFMQRFIDWRNSMMNFMPFPLSPKK